MTELFDSSRTETPFILATVIEVKAKDGKQSNRYQVQPHVGQDSGTVKPEDTIEVSYIDQAAPHYTLGHTGTRYKKGQTVMLYRMGQQEFMIMGALPNSVPDEGQNDHTINSSHPKGLSKWLHRIAPKVGSLPKAYLEDMKGLLGSAETFQSMLPRDVVKLRTELEARFRMAKRMGKDPIKDLEGIVRRVLREYKELGRYAATAKNVNWSVGGFSIDKGDLKNPTKYIMQLIGKKGELIPNAFDMMEKLKASGKAGTPISAPNSVGGIGLIQQALAGVAQIRSQQANNQFDLLEYLCMLYEELFAPLKCKDENGKFTPAFEKWKKEYMLLLNIQQELV